MRRIIRVEAGELDHPVDLQTVQEAGANWNGQTIDLTWNVVINGRLKILRAPISIEQAKLFSERLTETLKKTED